MNIVCIDAPASETLAEAAKELGWEGRQVTWTEKMKALIDGAIDLDDWEEIAMSCAGAADSATGQYCWCAGMPTALDRLNSLVGEVDNPAESKVARELMECAQAADSPPIPATAQSYSTKRESLNGDKLPMPSYMLDELEHHVDRELSRLKERIIEWATRTYYSQSPPF